MVEAANPSKLDAVCHPLPCYADPGWYRFSFYAN